MKAQVVFPARLWGLVVLVFLGKFSLGGAFMNGKSFPLKVQTRFDSQTKLRDSDPSTNSDKDGPQEKKTPFSKFGSFSKKGSSSASKSPFAKGPPSSKSGPPFSAVKGSKSPFNPTKSGSFGPPPGSKTFSGSSPFAKKGNSPPSFTQPKQGSSPFPSKTAADGGEKGTPASKSPFAKKGESSFSGPKIGSSFQKTSVKGSSPFAKKGGPATADSSNSSEQGSVKATPKASKSVFPGSKKATTNESKDSDDEESQGPTAPMSKKGLASFSQSKVGSSFAPKTASGTVSVKGSSPFASQEGPKESASPFAKKELPSDGKSKQEATSQANDSADAEIAELLKMQEAAAKRVINKGRAKTEEKKPLPSFVSKTVKGSSPLEKKDGPISSESKEDTKAGLPSFVPRSTGKEGSQGPAKDSGSVTEEKKVSKSVKGSSSGVEKDEPTESKEDKQAGLPAFIPSTAKKGLSSFVPKTVSPSSQTDKVETTSATSDKGGKNGKDAVDDEIAQLLAMVKAAAKKIEDRGAELEVVKAAAKKSFFTGTKSASVKDGSLPFGTVQGSKPSPSAAQKAAKPKSARKGANYAIETSANESLSFQYATDASGKVLKENESGVSKEEGSTASEENSSLEEATIIEESTPVEEGTIVDAKDRWFDQR